MADTFKQTRRHDYATSDPDAQGIHFTDEACRIWADYLKNNV